jgi:hypothetical protein
MAKPDSGKITVLKQICELIPTHMVAKLGREFGCVRRARTFTVWSHVVSMIYAQLARVTGLNDLCDDLSIHSGPLSSVRGAKTPHRNTLAHANKVRDAGMAQELFWSLKAYFEATCAGFNRGRRYIALDKRIKSVVHAVDSSTIELVASCLDWARHRRKKAAAKLHMNLDLTGCLPAFAIVDSAKSHDSTKAAELCSQLGDGDTVVFDMAYIDFSFFWDLAQRGINWVTRRKANITYTVAKKLPVKKGGRILKDCLIRLKNPKTKADYPQTFRLVIAIVEIDGKDREMEFITNNTEWSASTIAMLYKCRWAVEVFFKEIKQNLKLCDFLGNSANAVQWQVWMALVTWLLTRYLAYITGCTQCFTRVFNLLRATVWSKLDIKALLATLACGTACGPPQINKGPAAPASQPWLPGFAPA